MNLAFNEPILLIFILYCCSLSIVLTLFYSSWCVPLSLTNHNFNVFPWITNFPQDLFLEYGWSHLCISCHNCIECCTYISWLCFFSGKVSAYSEIIFWILFSSCPNSYQNIFCAITFLFLLFLKEICWIQLTIFI